MKRIAPEMGSRPTEPRSRPMTTMINPFRIDPPPRSVAMSSPKRVSEKYSGGPNFRANSARGGATKVRPSTPMVPAMKEPMAAMPRAGPARPFFAIWYPSIQVTTEAASPGMLTRMEVVDPPYMAP